VIEEGRGSPVAGLTRRGIGQGVTRRVWAGGHVAESGVEVHPWRCAEQDRLSRQGRAQIKSQPAPSWGKKEIAGFPVNKAQRNGREF